MSAFVRGSMTALLIATLGGGLAQAQPAARPAAPAAPAAPAPAPVAPAATPADSPERTMAVFGDWVVRCEGRAATATAPAGRNCEMAQTTTDQRQQPVAVLALGRQAKGEPLRLVAQLPVNVQPGPGARLTLDLPGRAEPPLPLPFRHCIPNGCFADAELRDEALLRRLRGRPAEAAGKLEWRNAAGAESSIPVSFRGFGAAYEALAKEAE